MQPWMVLFAFWASLILTVFKIAELTYRWLRAPRLDFHLTPDAFFRLTEYGETLFCNSVSLAWNGPLVIVDTQAILTKTDQPVKSFPFRVLEFGEKVKGAGALPDHYFHSRSAISHLAEAKPERTLYLCVQEKYEEQSRRVINDFRSRVLDYKQSVLSQASVVAPDDEVSLRQEILRTVNTMVDEGLGRMMELVQLEPGEYKLTVQVDYRNPRSRLPRKRSVSSSIKFTIGTDVRDSFRINLRQTLLVSATNLIFDQQTPFVYPEYAPLQIATA